MSLHDKESAHLRINQSKYKEGYDRIFGKGKVIETPIKLDDVPVYIPNKVFINEAGLIEEKLIDVAHKGTDEMARYIADLEDKLNESQTRAHNLLLENHKLKKQIGLSFNEDM